MLKLSLIQILAIILLISLLSLCLAILNYGNINLQKQKTQLINEKDNLSNNLNKIEKEIKELKSQDQYKRNEKLQQTIKNIEETYSRAVEVYETIQDLAAQGQNVDNLKKDFTKTLKYLSDKNYTKAQTTLTSILKKETKIKEEIARKEQEELAKKKAAEIKATPTTTTPTIIEPAPVDNSLPSDGQYKRIIADVSGQQFTVSIIAGNLSTTKVIVDTSSKTDCNANCPLLSLSQFAVGNGAFAGVNGSYFCPAAYPSCVGKENSFEFFAVNSAGTFFNESEIGISSYPAVRFRDSSMEIIPTLLYWKKDTSARNILTNYPLLVQNSQQIYTGGYDSVKIVQRSNRSFVGNISNTVYIGTVHNASVLESAQALNALGMDNALNLDSGGSTALWYDGSYKLGPGRNLPNTILFIKK